jgi:hypothetical protein
MTRELMQQALEYIERHAIIDGIPVRDVLRAALSNELFGNSEELVMRPELASWPFPLRDSSGAIIIPPKPVPVREEALF